jgi:hypothetical protein
MQFRKKSGFILLEVLVSIVLFSIIALGTVEFIFSLRQSNIETTNGIVNSLKLESTRLFLGKNTDFSLLNLSGGNLYFNGNLLLDQISRYQLNVVGDIATFDICIQDNKICQIWKIKV